MPLATYADLQAAIASWLARDDLASAIPDFIVLFEAAANRRLRVRQMETSVSLTPDGGGAVALPADYLQWRRVTRADGGDLEYVRRPWMQAAYAGVGAVVPSAFSIEGSHLVVPTTSGAAVVLTYFRRITALSAGANWLYTAHPDLYLFGALTEAKGFVDDEQKAALWKLRRDELFGEVEQLDQKGKAPGAIRIIGTVV